MSEKIKKICKNCRLYNEKDGICSVNILHEGEYYELPVRPYDRCWWERMEQELSCLDGEETEINIQELRIQYDLDNKKVKVHAEPTPDLGSIIT